jgi:hypothetical protein
MCDPHGEHSPNEAIDSIPELPTLVPKDTRTEASPHNESVSTRDFAPTENQARDDDDLNSVASSESHLTAICHAPTEISRITSVTDVGFTPVKEINVLDSFEEKSL